MRSHEADQNMHYVNPRKKEGRKKDKEYLKYIFVCTTIIFSFTLS